AVRGRGTGGNRAAVLAAGPSGGRAAEPSGADRPIDRSRVRPGVAAGVDRSGFGWAGSTVDRGCGDGVGVAMRRGAVTVNEAVTADEFASGDETAVALAGLLRACEPPSAALALFVAKVGAVAAWRGV